MKKPIQYNLDGPFFENGFPDRKSQKSKRKKQKSAKVECKLKDIMYEIETLPEDCKYFIGEEAYNKYQEDLKKKYNKI